jgi:hypothetical protein
MSSAQPRQADDRSAVRNMHKTSAAKEKMEGNNRHGTAASMEVDAVSIHRGVDIMKLSQGKVHRN